MGSGPKDGLVGWYQRSTSATFSSQRRPATGRPDRVGPVRATTATGAWGCASDAASARPRPAPGCRARRVSGGSCLCGMLVRLGVHAGPGAHPDRAILRVLLAVLARGCPPRALLGAGELLAMPPWPPNLRTDRWRGIGVEAAIAAQPHQHGDLRTVEFRQFAGQGLGIVASIEDEQRDGPGRGQALHQGVAT